MKTKKRTQPLKPYSRVYLVYTSYGSFTCYTLAAAKELAEKFHHDGFEYEIVRYVKEKQQ